MAKKRMFSLKVIDTDDFLDMPMTAQYLYFHLAMRADDDGFLGNQKRIMRMIGSNDDDFKVLLAKRYIIEFDSGIIVIRHWRMHNYIQKDRYVETEYLKEKSTLVENNGKYETKKGLDTKCIQNVYKMDTQVMLGKVSIGKNSIDKNKRKKISNSYTYAKFKQEKISILEEAKKKYPDKDCERAIEEFIEYYDSHKRDKIINFYLAFLRWVRVDQYGQYARRQNKLHIIN